MYKLWGRVIAISFLRVYASAAKQSRTISKKASVLDCFAYARKDRSEKACKGRASSLLALFLMLPPLLYALPDDNKQPLLVRADTADLNQAKHLGIYQGHVKIDQGSTHIRSAKTTTVGNAQNKLIMATFEGDSNKQAHYWTRQTADKPIFHAYADKIYYCPEQFKIILSGHARALQEKNQITASTICYNTKTQQVTTSFQGEQTKIIVQSESLRSIGPDV